jgi:hypothetical protein
MKWAISLPTSTPKNRWPRLFAELRSGVDNPGVDLSPPFLPALYCAVHEIRNQSYLAVDVGVEVSLLIVFLIAWLRRTSLFC